MSSGDTVSPKRRHLQLLAGVCAIGAGIGVAKLLVARPPPPSGNPTSVDFRDIPIGKLLTVDWRGRMVIILHRSAQEVAALADHESELGDPDFAYSLQTAACRNRQKLGFDDVQRTDEALKGISGKRLTYRRINAQSTAQA